VGNKSYRLKTVDEAKTYLRANWEKGVSCPCCGRLVKKYNRLVHATMALCLIRLYHLTERSEENYFHVREIVEGISGTGTGDFSKFKYFGLITEKPKDDEDTKSRTSGFWSITPKGKLFVENNLPIPARVEIYNQTLVGFNGTPVLISDVLGKKFDYQELMKGA
jgi:hypothetical protein